MPDPTNPASYSADDMALMTPQDMTGLPPAAMRALITALMARGQQQAPPPAQQGAPPMDDLAFLSSLSPERRAENAAMGTLDEEGQLLEGQLAAAQALQSRPMAQRETLGGAIGSGLASVLDSVSGGLQARDLRAKQEALLRRKDKGRAAYQDDLARFRLQQQQRVQPSAGAGDGPLLYPGMG